MPPKKGNTPIKIQQAARQEFLKNGFRNTSVQKIAEIVGITSQGFYKHFENKEVLFSSLVEPIIIKIRSIMHIEIESKDKLIEKNQESEVWDKDRILKETLDYIYDNFEDMKLLICCADGSKYENIIDTVAEYETNIVLKNLPTLRENGVAVPDISDETILMLMKHEYRSLVEFIKNNYTREEAEEYIKNVNEFYTAGWRALLKF